MTGVQTCALPIYPDEAEITAGRVLDVNTHRWRHIPTGEVIEFLD